jgi:hypothetical protein
MAEPADAKPERSQEGEASGASRTECHPSLDAGIPSRATRRRYPEPSPRTRNQATIFAPRKAAKSSQESTRITCVDWSAHEAVNRLKQMGRLQVE